jgi:hypothetical protein
MVFELIQYFEAGKHALEVAVTQALPGVFGAAYGMITSGNLNQAFAGVLFFVGMGVILWRGLWKIVAKVLWRQLNVV